MIPEEQGKFLLAMRNAPTREKARRVLEDLCRKAGVDPPADGERVEDLASRLGLKSDPMVLSQLRRAMKVPAQPFHS
ncbi:MAG: hypothetical protein JWP91_1332 [Fibrobacteres bacterium]|nr:hypothetical protein [Fibrobacterota bacterium]